MLVSKQKEHGTKQKCMQTFYNASRLDTEARTVGCGVMETSKNLSTGKDARQLNEISL